MAISIAYLQKYIKAKDFQPDKKEQYFMKLAEEVGEVSRAMRKNLRPQAKEQVKDTLDEELYDVIYYALALANCYDIDLEQVIPLKEKLANEKYHHQVRFEPEKEENL